MISRKIFRGLWKKIPENGCFGALKFRNYFSLLVDKQLVAYVYLNKKGLQARSLRRSGTISFDPRMLLMYRCSNGFDGQNGSYRMSFFV